MESGTHDEPAHDEMIETIETIETAVHPVLPILISRDLIR